MGLTVDYLKQAEEVYADGPFKGKRKIHPYRTVLSRLSQMGITPHVRQATESDRAYVERMNRDYFGIFSDVLEEGVLNEVG